MTLPVIATMTRTLPKPRGAFDAAVAITWMGLGTRLGLPIQVQRAPDTGATAPDTGNAIDLVQLVGRADMRDEVGFSTTTPWWYRARYVSQSGDRVGAWSDWYGVLPAESTEEPMTYDPRDVMAVGMTMLDESDVGGRLKTGTEPGATESTGRQIDRLLAKPLVADPDTFDSVQDGVTYRRVVTVNASGQVTSPSISGRAVTDDKQAVRTQRVQVVDGVGSYLGTPPLTDSWLQLRWDSSNLRLYVKFTHGATQTASRKVRFRITVAGCTIASWTGVSLEGTEGFLLDGSSTVADSTSDGATPGQWSISTGDDEGYLTLTGLDDTAEVLLEIIDTTGGDGLLQRVTYGQTTIERLIDNLTSADAPVQFRFVVNASLGDGNISELGAEKVGAGGTGQQLLNGLQDSLGRPVNTALGKSLSSDPDTLDSVADGVTHGKVNVDALTGGAPDLSKSGVLGRNGENIDRSSGDSTPLVDVVQNLDGTGDATSGMQDSLGRPVNKALDKSLSGDPDTLDGVPEGTTYRRVTVNEKDGAGRAYDGLNSTGQLTGGLNGTQDLEGGSLNIEDTETINVGSGASPSVKVKKVRFPFAEFIPKNDAEPWDIPSSAIYLYPNATGSHEYFCPLWLPVGVEITAIRINGYVGTTSDFISGDLYRLTSNGSTTVLTGGGLSIAGTPGWAVDTVALAETVADGYSYVLKAILFASAAALDARFFYMEIEYEMPSYDAGY